MAEQVNNRRIANNAVALTLRMILVTLVGLYTSRVVLNVLGDVDYGIWGVIGGVVAMGSFLNAAMAGATLRFITYTFGQGDQKKLSDTFSTSIMVHLGIAATVAVLAETAGLWFVNVKMNFPPDRMLAVNILYQLTIIAMVVIFTQMPYTSAIIAHEKLKFNAWVESVIALLKLGCVFLLLLIPSDRLILYGIFFTTLQLLQMGVCRIYCIRHFPECRTRFHVDRKILKDMVKFSVSNLYGRMGLIAQQQGIPILLNLFFGVIANTAGALAFNVFTATNSFTNSVSQAFQPQIIKQYAGGDIGAMERLMGRSVQFTTLVFAIVAVPLMVETPRVLWLWLGQVPEYSVTFIRLSLLMGLFMILEGVNNTAIHATGRVRNISLISGTLYLLSPVVAYCLMKWAGWGVNTVYEIALMPIIGVIPMGWILLKVQISGLNVWRYIMANVRAWIAIAVAGAMIVYLVCSGYIAPEMDITHTYLRNLWLVVQTILVTTAVLTACAFTFVFGKSERQFLIDKILRRKTGE